MSNTPHSSDPKDKRWVITYNTPKSLGKWVVWRGETALEAVKDFKRLIPPEFTITHTEPYKLRRHSNNA